MIVLGLVFSIGSTTAVLMYKVESLAGTVEKYESTPLRLQKLETVQGYIRNDVEDTKEQVAKNYDLLLENQQTIKGLDRLIRGLPR